jgi:hypothetical protein
VARPLFLARSKSVAPLAAVLFALFGPLAPSRLCAHQQENGVIGNEASAAFIDGSGQRRSVQSNKTQLTIVRAKLGRLAEASKATSSIETSSGSTPATADVASACACREAPSDACACREAPAGAIADLP